MLTSGWELWGCRVCTPGWELWGCRVCTPWLGAVDVYSVVVDV